MQFRYEIRTKSSSEKIAHQSHAKTKKKKNKQSEEDERLDQSILSVDPTILELYLMQVRKLIESKKFYPASAKRLKIEGDVTLKFSIDRSGHISGIEFLQKANFNPLNDAALSAIESVGKFPSLPTEIKDDTLVIHQKITFKF